MRRKLYSSRTVKVEGIVYVPKPKSEMQETARVFFVETKSFLRVQALIYKYKMVVS